MKKVLIALDYHPASEIVAKAGHQLAQKLGAEVCLLHVVADASYYQISYPEFMGYVPVSKDVNVGDEMKEILKTGEDFLKQTVAKLNGSSAITHLEVGNAKDAILNYSEKWGADIIVMGTHSHNAIEKIVLGTVVSSVIEQTKIPVHLVPVKK